MNLFVDAGGQAHVGRLSLRPKGWAKAADLDVDLDRPWIVEAELEHESSPLQALLGLDGSPTRALEFAFTAGAGWLTWPIGSERDGAEVVAEVTAMVGRRSGHIEALHRALLLADAEPKAAERIRARLAELVATVRIVPAFDNETGRWIETYESEDPIALAAVELLVREQRGDKASECRLCGRPFLAANRSDEVYCRRAAPGQPFGGRSCHELGPQRLYAAELGELESAYRTEYKRLDKWARRDHIDRRQLDRWRKDARAALEQGRRRRWSVERFRRELEGLEPQRKGR